MNPMTLSVEPELAEYSDTLPEIAVPLGGPRNDTADVPASAVDGASAAPAEPDRRSLYAALSDRRLRERLLAHLIGKCDVIPHRAEDVVQMTYVRALRARTWPTDASKMYAWMKAIAVNSFIADMRKRERREEVEELRGDMDIAPAEPDPELAVRVTEAAQSVAAESPYNAATLEMLTKEPEEEPVATIASEWAISKEAYYTRKSRFVARVRARMVEIASMSVSGIALMLLLHTLTVVALVSTVGDAPPVPGPNDPLPALREHESPRSMRDRGLSRCRVGDYAGCVALLDRAKKADPDGDRDPKVAAARAEAERARHPNAAPAHP